MKKFLIVLLSALTLGGCMTTTAFAAENKTNTSNIIGDVDGDGIVSILDASMVQGHLLGAVTLSDSEAYRADVDQNGYVSISDITYIQQYAAGLINKFPYEDTGIIRNNIIPNGCTYKKADGTVLKAGEKFPTPSFKDQYEEGDYIYTYNNKRKIDGISVQWTPKVKNISKTSYGKLISEIANCPVNSLAKTFANCSSLTSAPEIPKNVIDLDYAFYNCSALEKATTIPEKVKHMVSTFRNCSSLTGVIDILAAPTAYDYCFAGTKKTITLAGIYGKSGNLSKIGETSSLNNIHIISTATDNPGEC